MRRPVLNGSLNLAFYLSITALVVAVIQPLHKFVSEDNRPPLKIYSVEGLPRQAKVGEQVLMISDRELIRLDCIGSVYELWLITETKHEIQGGVRPIMLRSQERATISLPKTIPLTAPYGELCYIPTINYACPEGHYAIDVPPVCFEIIQ